MSKTLVPPDVMLAVDILGTLYSRDWNYTINIPKLVDALPGSYSLARTTRVVELLAASEYLISEAKGYYLNRSVLNRSLKRMCEDIGFDVLRDIEHNLESPSSNLEEQTAILYRGTTVSFMINKGRFNEVINQEAERASGHYCECCEEDATNREVIETFYGPNEFRFWCDDCFQHATECGELKCSKRDSI